MNHQVLINTCVFEQIQGLLFSDLSGPLSFRDGKKHTWGRLSLDSEIGMNEYKFRSKSLGVDLQ